MLTYNSWCGKMNACDWFPFLRKKNNETPTPSTSSSDTPSPDGIPSNGSGDNNTPGSGTYINEGCTAEKPRWDPKQKKCIAAPTGEGCDGTVKVDKGCTCTKPFWNGSACVAKKDKTPCPHTIHRGCWCAKPFYDKTSKSCVEKKPTPAPQPQKVDCRAQATSNTGYFTSCKGTGGKERERCIARNRKICMDQPGATW
jgi:hypothetical protein